MVERIGKDSALAREALRAALERTSSARAGAAGAARDAAPSEAEATRSGGPDFGRVLAAGLDEVEQKLDATESLPADLLTGKIGDFHEIAVQLKSTELSFKFAMEIRNKLVDAYREIMRMSV